MVENIWLKISKNISGSRDQWLSAKSTVSPVASSVRIQIQNLTLFLGGSRSGAEGHLFIVDVVVEYVQWNHVCALIINKTLVQSVLALDGFFHGKFSLCKQFFISRELEDTYNLFFFLNINLIFVPPEKGMRLRCAR